MKYVGLVVLVGLGTLLYGAREHNLAKGALPPEAAEPATFKSSRAEESGPPCVATYARFKRLKQGYREGFVKHLMGCEGTMVSAQRIGNYNYRTFRWDGEQPGSFMVVTYSDYLVNSITQMGLQ